MPTEVMNVIEEAPPEEHEVPDVEIRGDEAVIRISTPEGNEERAVRLPKATWA